MFFVELLRLLVVLAGVLGGEELSGGDHAGATARVIGAVLGALVGYVVGGIIGRLLHRGIRDAARTVRDMPAPEVLAGALLGSLGVILGLIVCIPLFVEVRSAVDMPIAAAVAVVVGELGRRVGYAKGAQLADAAGLTKRISTRAGKAPAGAMLVDASAVMDRSLLALGRAGLLPHDVLVPEFVIDQVRTIADGPDPVAARRARRGLEGIEALRGLGISIAVASGDIPSAESADAKVATMAGEMGVRVATCSGALAASLEELEMPVLDLRRLCGELTPDHVPGERLRVDLIRPGRQPRQAIGYLPDGDMVVVNDADGRIGWAQVEVEVLSTRQTSQGLLVFARLADESEDSREPRPPEPRATAASASTSAPSPAPVSEESDGAGEVPKVRAAVRRP
jgi:uncharacterized protein YacL